jgi:hypothetical protein
MQARKSTKMIAAIAIMDPKAPVERPSSTSGML